MSDQPPRDPDASPADVGRRSFFRHLGRNAVRAAGNAAGTVDIVRRGSVAAAGGLLGIGLDPLEVAATEAAAAAAAVPPTVSEPTEPGTSRDTPRVPEYRSPYRLQGDMLLILDQRRLPYELVDVPCSDGHGVARAIADGAIRGGQVLAQVAAYGMFLTSRAVRARSDADRDAAIRSAADALLRASPSARPLTYAVERMLARWQVFRRRPAPDDPAEVMRTEPGALRAEADAIATESQLDHAKLARRAAASIAPPDGRPTGLLVHGNPGALGGGMLGTALGVVQRLLADGREVHVWATESRPSRDGERLTTLELRRFDAPFTLIADAAAGALLASGRVDAVLLGAEHIARNGDVANTVGSFPIAAVAASLGVPVLVCTPSCTIGPDTPDGRAIQAASPADDDGAPLLDTTPGSLITAIYTEHGRVDPRSAEQLKAAYERGAKRRLPHGPGPAAATSSAVPEALAG